MITHFGNASRGGPVCKSCNRYCVKHSCAVCSSYGCETHHDIKTSEELDSARIDYIKRSDEHAKAAKNLETSSNANSEIRDYLEMEEHYSQEAADAAFGFLARAASKEGFRALLSGELKKEDSR